MQRVSHPRISGALSIAEPPSAPQVLLLQLARHPCRELRVAACTALQV